MIPPKLIKCLTGANEGKPSLAQIVFQIQLTLKTVTEMLAKANTLFLDGTFFAAESSDDDKVVIKSQCMTVRATDVSM